MHAMGSSVQDELLRIEGVNKSFSGVQVLKDVHLEVKPATVHALMGENGAGKSTLMKCLFGIYRQDSGRFFLEGEEFNFQDPRHALENGVSMVHQELNQVIQRSISDNIWLGRYPKRGPFVDERSMHRKTSELFKRINIHLDADILLNKLSVSQRQMVEIAKAISYDAKVIVLDEPTSSLTDNETKLLFTIIESLKEQGVSIIYISHKMDEIFLIADEVTVLRDGAYIGTRRVADINMEILVEMMVGRELEERFPPRTNTPGEVHFEVRNLSTRFKPVMEDISFAVRRGEILGVAGLVGAGRTEVAEAVFGIRTRNSGEFEIDGHSIRIDSPKHAKRNGFAFLTEERRRTGIYPMANITFNSTIANISAYTNRVGWLVDRKMDRDTDKQIERMRIKTPNKKELIRTLSGGNQQKVIIGRWLLTNPDILILDEPTRGIDVGAKFEIYQLIIDLASQNKSVIMISSEMPELLGITNRILVMSNGRVAGVVNTDETDQTEIFHLAMKYMSNTAEAEV
jgi:methyl-galactoside transport system ATP-binding protein